MTHRSTARAIGILFITATVAFSVSVVLLGPVLSASDYLTLVSANKLRVAAGILLELINHIAVVGIAVVSYPILKQYSERLAVGYVAVRSIESVLFAIGTMHLVALVNVSHTFVIAESPPPSYFQTLGGILLSGHDWDNAEILFTAFSLGALMLNYLLYRTKLVPRLLSGWGFIAAILILAARVMVICGLGPSSYVVFMMDAPIMLQEMVFAIWLIVKGFNETVLAQGEAHVL